MAGRTTPAPDSYVLVGPADPPSPSPSTPTRESRPARATFDTPPTSPQRFEPPADDGAPLLPAAVRRPGSAADLPGAVAELMHPNADGLDALLGPDPFGVRRLPKAPEFLAGFDYSNLPAEKTAAFFNTIDMVRSHAPEPADLQPQALSNGPVSRSSSPPVDGQGPHQVPHVSLSIWLGGPLHDDHGARREFMKNLSAGKSSAKDFEYIVLTDVPRAEFDRVREIAEHELTERTQPVHEMLIWARENNIRLINIDEVFNAEHGSEMLASAHVERARRNGNGYAGASDIARAIFLSTFGGVYSDGDNLVIGDPALATAAAANSSIGLAFGRERNGALVNAVIAAAAGSTGIKAYAEVLRENHAMTYSDLAIMARTQLDDLNPASLPAEEHVRLNQANTLESPGDDLLGIPAIPKSQTTMAEETVLRTGPNRVTFDRVARRLGMSDRGELPRVPDGVYRVESSQSWITPSRNSDDSPSVDTQTLADAVIGAVTSLHRETRTRPGIVYLPSAARTINRLPAHQREAAWNTALRTFKDTLAPGTAIQRVSATNLDLPSGPRSLINELFPGAPVTELGSAEPEVTASAAPHSTGTAGSGRVLTALFASQSKILSSEQQEEVAGFVDDLIDRAVRARAAGTPLPQLAITGYGRGQMAGFFGQNNQAMNTGRQRADALRQVLHEQLRERLNREAPDVSRVRAEDFVITTDSKGTEAGPSRVPLRSAQVVEQPGTTHTVVGDQQTQAPSVPKSLHFVWLGDRVISPRTQENLQDWAARANSVGYTMNLWVDDGATRANTAFLNELGALATVSHVNDLLTGHSASARRSDDVSAELDLALRHGVHDVASDLARYTILHRESGGGIYVDADIAPGDVQLPAEAPRLDPDGIPFFGPETRDPAQRDQQYDAGNLGNRFIIAQPRSAFLGSLINRITAPGDSESLLNRLQAIDAAGPSARTLIEKLAAEAPALSGSMVLQKEIESRLRSPERPQATLGTEFRSGRAMVDPALRAQWDGLDWNAVDSARIDRAPQSPSLTVEPTGDVITVPAVEDLLPRALADLLARAPAEARSHTWFDPASARSVESAFDVRRVEHDGRRVTELTVAVRVDHGTDVSDHDLADTWQRVNAGVHEFFNGPQHRFPHGELAGDLFRVKVVPAEPGQHAHLDVTLVPYAPGRLMTQRTWVVGQPPVFYAHELAHQIAARDESGQASRAHRLKDPFTDQETTHVISRTANNLGSLMGDFSVASEGDLRQSGLRPRHLDLFAAAIGDIAPFTGQEPASAAPATPHAPARQPAQRPSAAAPARSSRTTRTARSLSIRAFLDTEPQQSASVRAEQPVESSSSSAAAQAGPDAPETIVDAPAPRTAEPAAAPAVSHVREPASSGNLPPQESVQEPVRENGPVTGGELAAPGHQRVPGGLGWGVARWTWSWGLQLGASDPGSLYDAVLAAAGGSLVVENHVIRRGDELRGFVADRMLTAPPAGELWPRLTDAYRAAEAARQEGAPTDAPPAHAAGEIDSGQALQQMVAGVRQAGHWPELDDLIAPWVISNYVGRGLLVLGAGGQMSAFGSGRPLVVAEAAGPHGVRQWLGFRPNADGPVLGGSSAAQVLWSAGAGMAFTGPPGGGTFFEALAAAARTAEPDGRFRTAATLQTELAKQMRADTRLDAAPGWERISAAYAQAADGRQLDGEAWQQIIAAVADGNRGGALGDAVLRQLLPILAHHYLGVSLRVVRPDGAVDHLGEGQDAAVAPLTTDGGDTSTGGRAGAWLGLVPVAPARLWGAGTRPMDVAGGWAEPVPAESSVGTAGPVTAAAPVTSAGPVSKGMSAPQLDWVTRHRRRIVRPPAGDGGFLPSILTAVGGRFSIGETAVNDVTDLRRVLVDRLTQIARTDPYLAGKRPDGPSEHGIMVRDEDDPTFPAWRAAVVYTVYKALYQDARRGEEGLGHEADRRIDDGRAFDDIIASIQDPGFWPELAENVVPYFMDELGLAVRVVDDTGAVHRYGAGRTAYVAPVHGDGVVSWVALPPMATRFPAGPPLGDPNRSDPVLVRLGQAFDARRAAGTDTDTRADGTDPVMGWLRELRRQWLAQTGAEAAGTPAVARSAEWLTMAVNSLTRHSHHTGHPGGQAPGEVAAGLSLGSAVELAGTLFPPDRGGIRPAPEPAGEQAVPPSGVPAGQWIVSASLRDLTGAVPERGAALFLRGRQTWVVVDTTDGLRLVEFDPDTRPMGEVSVPSLGSDPAHDDAPGLALVIDASGQVLPADSLDGTFAPATGWDGEPPFGAAVPGRFAQGDITPGVSRFSPAQEAWAREHMADLADARPGDDSFFEAATARGPLLIDGTEVSTAAELRQALGGYLRTRFATADSAAASLVGSVFRLNAEQRHLEDNDYDRTKLHRDALHHQMSEHLESGKAIGYLANAIETPGHWEQVTQLLAPHLLAESAGVHLLVLEPDGRVRGYGDQSRPRLTLARAETGMAAPDWASVVSRKPETDAEPFGDVTVDTTVPLSVTEHVTEPGGELATLTDPQQRFADDQGLRVQPTPKGPDSVYSAILAAAGGVLHLDTETAVHDAPGLRTGLARLVRDRPDVLDAAAWGQIATIPGYEDMDLEQVIDGLTNREAVNGDLIALTVAVPYLGIQLTVLPPEGEKAVAGEGRRLVIAAPRAEQAPAHWAALTPVPVPARDAVGPDAPNAYALERRGAPRRSRTDYEIVARGATKSDGWREPSYCAMVMIGGKWQNACVSVMVIEVAGVHW